MYVQNVKRGSTTLEHFPVLQFKTKTKSYLTLRLYRLVIILFLLTEKINENGF